MTTYNIFKLVEKDKEYLVKPAPPTLGELVDFSKVLKKVRHSNDQIAHYVIWSFCF